MSLFGSNGKGGVIDSIMNIKQHLTIECIYSNIFRRQGKEKAYLFKMLVDRPSSSVDFVKRIQLEGNLENAWLMFDYVKHV